MISRFSPLKARIRRAIGARRRVRRGAGVHVERHRGSSYDSLTAPRRDQAPISAKRRAGALLPRFSSVAFIFLNRRASKQHRDWMRASEHAPRDRARRKGLAAMSAHEFTSCRVSMDLSWPLRCRKCVHPSGSCQPSTTRGAARFSSVEPAIGLLEGTMSANICALPPRCILHICLWPRRQWCSILCDI